MLHLKEIREKKNISMYELAKLSGVDRGNISRMESGKLKPENITIGTLVKLARVLNVNIDEILDLEEL